MHNRPHGNQSLNESAVRINMMIIGGAIFDQKFRDTEKANKILGVQARRTRTYEAETTKTLL